MLCHKGIWVEKQGMHVPCGQCLACRINKKRKWTGRILLETAFPVLGPARPWMITLTYDEDRVPADDDSGNLTLDKQAFRSWLKNVKKSEGYFRYYAVGEYGETTQRPHYHMAVFPRDDYQIYEIRDHWKETYGFTHLAEINTKTAGYLAQYTTKKLTQASDPRLLPGQEPEFRNSSRNPPLGFGAVESIADIYRSGSGKKLLDKRGDIERALRFDTKIYPLDQFMLNKIRSSLGVPLLHRERIKANPNYLDFHDSQEAEVDWHQATLIEAKLEGQLRQRLLSGNPL